MPDSFVSYVRQEAYDFSLNLYERAIAREKLDRELVVRNIVALRERIREFDPDCPDPYDGNGWAAYLGLT